MDNDNKIKNTKQSTDQRHKEVLLFLNEELNRLQTQNISQSYDLEKEYAKTKKNKSLFSVLILFISLTVVFLSAWGITAYINKQNQKITVNLQEFEGLNIKNLLDSVSKVQANYDAAMKSKTNIISDRDVALRKAEEKRDSELFLIDSLSLDSKEEIRKRKALVYEEYEKAVAEINEEYEPQILLAENELAEYKKQLDEYDTAKLEAARQQEQALDSERRVHQMEIDKLTQEYEARIAEIQNSIANERRTNSDQMRSSVTEVSQKYIAEIAQLDPDLSLNESQPVVAGINMQFADAFDSELFIDDYALEDDTAIEGLLEFQEAYNQYNSVREPLENIPYKNSVPSYLKASKKLVDIMGSTFAETVATMSDEKIDLEYEIEDLEYEIEDLEEEINDLYGEVDNLNAQIDKLNLDNEAEKVQLQQDFEDAKLAIAREYADVYDGILASAKAQAVVISANSKEEIRIYVIPAAREHITEAGIGAEIKASKSVKGMIKPIADEPGFYLFENALDKAGNPVDFDFSLIAIGQFVKISAK